MGTLCDIFGDVERNKKRLIEEQIAETSLACTQSLKRTLISFLFGVLAERPKRAREFGCVILGAGENAVARQMLRLGVSTAQDAYGNVYFCKGSFFKEPRDRKEPLFKTPGRSKSGQGHEAVFAEVRELTDAEVAEELLTEECFRYLDRNYGERKMRVQKTPLARPIRG